MLLLRLWTLLGTYSSSEVSGMQVYNYPVVNHGRVRGLLQRLRSRLLHLQGERSALQLQLAELPLVSEDSQATTAHRAACLLCGAVTWPTLPSRAATARPRLVP